MSRKFLSEVLRSHERVFSALQNLEGDLVRVLKDVKEKYDEKISLIRHHLDLFLRIYEEELLLHFKVEEEAVFPYVRDRELIEELVKEHIIIVTKIDDLKKKRETDPYEALDILNNIIDILKKHVKKEDKLYSKMNEYLTIKEINEIRDKIKNIYDNMEVS